MAHKNRHHENEFPKAWCFFLKDELTKEFHGYTEDEIICLPPVTRNSIIGKMAAYLPSKPEGITIGGVVHLTKHYNKVRNLKHAESGAKAAKIYEFGMFAHETFHAVDQEHTADFPLLKGSGKWKWLIKYIARLIITPNAYKHPMEKPAYAFQKYMKLMAASLEDESGEKTNQPLSP